MDIKSLGVPELASFIGICDSYISKIVNLSDGIRAALSYDLLDADDVKGDYDLLFDNYKSLEEFRQALINEMDERVGNVFELKNSLLEMSGMIDGFIKDHPEVTYSIDGMEQVSRLRKAEKEKREKEEKVKKRRNKVRPIKDGKEVRTDT